MSDPFTDDEMLRHSLEQLRLPGEENIVFDRERWRQTTRPQAERAQLARRWRISGFSVAGALFLVCLLGTPALFHGLRRVATVTSLSPGPTPLKSLRPVSFIDFKMVSATNGWGFANVGGGVFRSVQGTKVWKKVGTTYLPGSGISVFNVLSSQDAFYLFIHKNPSTITVERTVDGGHQWRITTLPVPERFGQGKIFSGALSSAWLNPWQGAMLVGSGAQTIRQVRLYLTHNAGSSWQYTPRQKVPGWGQLAVSAKNELWLYRPAQLWYSGNGGKTWTRQVFSALSHQTITVKGPPHFGPAGRHGAVAAVVGHRTTVYTTSDGGNTWQSQASIPSTSGIHFFRQNRYDLWIWSINRSTTKLWNSFNGGKTWTLVGSPQGLPPESSLSRAFLSYQFVSRHLGFAMWVAPGTTLIYESQNGGRTWHPFLPQARIGGSG